MARLVDALLKLQQALGVLLFVGLTTVVTLQIVSRFMFHAPFLWSEEVARFLFFWVALTGAGISVRLRRHFIIDIVQMAPASQASRRTARLQAWLCLTGDVAILGFSALLLLLGWEYTGFGTFRIGTNSQINMALVYAAIPFAAGTMVAYSVVNIAETLATMRRGGRGRQDGASTKEQE